MTFCCLGIANNQASDTYTQPYKANVTIRRSKDGVQITVIGTTTNSGSTIHPNEGSMAVLTNSIVLIPTCLLAYTNLKINDASSTIINTTKL